MVQKEAQSKIVFNAITRMNRMGMGRRGGINGGGN